MRVALDPIQDERASEQILVIEDDPDARENVRDILGLDGYVVLTAGTLSEVFERKDFTRVQVIVLDCQLPDGNSLDFLPRIRQHAPEASVVIVTGHPDLDGVIEALRQGAADFLIKPVNPDSLRIRVGRLLEQHRLAVAKERSDSLFRNLVEAAECQIVLLRPNDFTILYFSPYAERLTGYSADEVLGKSYLELLVPESEREVLAERSGQVLSGLPLHGFVGKIRCRDGSSRLMLKNARGVPDYNGAPALMIVGHDITELKDAEQRALHSERMAAIGQMCAGLAHESRNALQRSQACLEMLALKLEDRPDVLNLIDRIQQAQDDLHHLYEDVREFATPIRLAFSECRLAEIWRRAWEHLEPVHQGRQVMLHEPSNGLSLDCHGDPFRLEQVFRNILDNALAACTEPAEIAITGSAATMGGRDAVQIVIRDNGPGLNGEQRTRIFESFYTTKTRGTGLGMAIVKQIVEAHGGQVELGPAGGPGAEIILTLPRRQGH